MIITKLQGGLGNQLFQYSVGRHLAEKNKTDFKLDTSWFGVVPDRQYDLAKYAIAAEIASADEVRQLRDAVAVKIKNRILPFAERTYAKERFYHFDPEVLKLGSSVYLEGYWQSDKYFSPIADKIRQEFTLTQPLEGKNDEISKQIEKTNAVSLHVRRGDYVANQHTNNYHGTSPLVYYEAAVAKIAEKVRNPHFFIFSDDPTWTKENLLFDYPMTFVTGNEKAAQEDLRLMSQCKNFIIANSTFSWWGAWLCGNKDKTVIAPKQWFKTDENNDKDLIPGGWIRL